MRKQQGFSLIELMIALVLGLIISGSVIQIMSSSKVTERLNRAVASAQESGRFIIARLRQDILPAGRYDALDPNLNRLVDVVEEAAFLQNRPVILPNDFLSEPGLGSIQGAGGANDTLVVAAQTERDCRGFKLGYEDGEEFFVVNRYFVEGTTLRCVGYDGRVLRGQKGAEGNNGDIAVPILDEVYGFQVLYGISNHDDTLANSARPVRYVTADQLAVERTLESAVVSIRIAILVKGDSDVLIDPIPSFKLLNEPVQTPTSAGFYRKFETTITLRNVKNFLRSINI
jgi:type IV pilus assembly protein PilW